MVQLGGHPVYIQKEEVGLGTRETAEDVARTLACYHRDHRRARHRPSRPRRDGRGDRRAGPQPAVGHRPSAAGAGRPADGQAAGRPARGARIALSATAQQCLPVARPGLRLRRRRARHRQPRRLWTRGRAGRRAPGRRPGRSGRRRRDRLHRRLGVDGPGRREPSRREPPPLPGRRSADGESDDAWFLHCLPLGAARR